VTAVSWDQFVAFEDLATAGSSAVNAAALLERAGRAQGPRRSAALLLAGLFTAVGVGAAGDLAREQPAAGAVIEAALDMPLLVADLAVTAVLTMAARR
jgi:hypothetical protein